MSIYRRLWNSSCAGKTRSDSARLPVIDLFEMHVRCKFGGRRSVVQGSGDTQGR